MGRTGRITAPISRASSADEFMTTAAVEQRVHRRRLLRRLRRTDLPWFEHGGSAHRAIVGLVLARTLVPDRLGWSVNVDGLAGRVLFAIVLREVVL
jgi:hypothetical protein